MVLWIVGTIALEAETLERAHMALEIPFQLVNDVGDHLVGDTGASIFGFVEGDLELGQRSDHALVAIVLVCFEELRSRMEWSEWNGAQTIARSLVRLIVPCRAQDR